RRRHTRWPRDWSSDVCSSDLNRNMKKYFVVVLHLGYWLVYLSLVSYFYRLMPGVHKPGLLAALFFSKMTIFAILPALLGFYGFRSEVRRVGKECSSRLWPGEW